MIYLDYAATTPISKHAIDAWIKASDHYFANTQSLHEEGEQARNLFESCKSELARLISCCPEEIYFTSSGSEANFIVLESLYIANKHKGNHVITSSIEHPSVLSFFQKLESLGVDVSYLPVESDGRISIKNLQDTIQEDTFLVSIQHVNSEIGIIQPIKEFGQLLHSKDIIFHSDCVQSFGKLPLEVGTLKVDALSISSHKIYGPKGVGAVYINKKISWSSTQPNTQHQNGFRQGTIDLPGIAAFTTAAVDIHENLHEQLETFWKLRDHFLLTLTASEIPYSVFGNNCTDSQLPSIIGLSIEGVEGQLMMQMLDRYHISVSTGTACQAGKQEASATMKALGKPEQELHRFFRLSLGKETSIAQLDIVAEKMIGILRQVLTKK